MIDIIVNKIFNELTTTFEEIENWFDISEDLADYNPKKGGWSIRKVLEHVSLTNHFLLILIKKGTLKSLEKAKTTSFSEILNDYDLDWGALTQIAQHKSFVWNRPEHMEPTGNLDFGVISNKLQCQLNECLGYLNQLKYGEGVLHKTMMTVNGLEKIDVYHYILFLAQHARRHLAQMKKIEEEFNLSVKR